MSEAVSIFEPFRTQVYEFRWRGTIVVDTLMGGTPSDPRKLEGWLRTKTGVTSDDLIREQVAKLMVERGITQQEAENEALINRNLNGFLRTPDGQLYLAGRALKAGLKEAANIRWPKRRWGDSRKGTRSYFAEHVFVEEDILPLYDADGRPITEPTGIDQRFVHTFRGSSIQYSEYVEQAYIHFHITSDFDFEHEDVAAMWLTGEQNGLGASRSQGFGRYAVVEWTPLLVEGKPVKAAKEEVLAGNGMA